MVLFAGCRPNDRSREFIYLKDSLPAIFQKDTARAEEEEFPEPLTSDSFQIKKPEKEILAGGFYIIKASYRNTAEARARKQQLENAYDRVWVLPSEQGYYRVAIARFTHWRGATGFIQKKYAEGDTNLWILHHRGGPM